MSDDAETREALARLVCPLPRDAMEWQNAQAAADRIIAAGAAEVPDDQCPDWPAPCNCDDGWTHNGLAALPPVAGPEVRPDETLRAAADDLLEIWPGPVAQPEAIATWLRERAAALASPAPARLPR